MRVSSPDKLMGVLSIERNHLFVTLRMNRPEKRNALNRDLVDQLHQAIAALSEDTEIRAIVLTGAGDAFSAGADLEVLRGLQNASYEENLADSQALGRLFEVMYLCPKPIIGHINGHAIAGGCGLATLCDITVSVPQARFGYTETQIGFVPALVSHFLPRKVSGTHASMLLLSGLLIDAEEAARIGLITEVANDTDERVAFWVDRFTTRVSPQAVVATKTLLREIPDLPLKDAMAQAAEANASARQTTDCRKGVAAFLNKDKIRW